MKKITYIVSLILIAAAGIIFGRWTASDIPSAKVSWEVQAMANDAYIYCDDMIKPKLNKLFWIDSVLDGLGVRLISKDNEENQYTVSFITPGHEHAIRTKKLNCN